MAVSTIEAALFHAWKEPMFSGLRSYSMALSHVWLGLPGGRFQSDGTSVTTGPILTVTLTLTPSVSLWHPVLERSGIHIRTPVFPRAAFFHAQRSAVPGSIHAVSG